MPATSWLSTVDAALALGVCDERIRQLIADGTIAAVQVGGRWLLRREDVEAAAGGRAAAGRKSR